MPSSDKGQDKSSIWPTVEMTTHSIKFLTRSNLINLFYKLYF